MAKLKELFTLLAIFSNLFLVDSFSLGLPHVNPGLFVIQGVSSCGNSDGYCLLSNSCLVDTDFESDTDGGHCDGLKHAFNPHADFVCCKYMPAPTTIAPPPVVKTPPPPPVSDDNTSYNLLVIQSGISTCNNGSGFCLLSDSCTIVQGFQSDPSGGHCSGLKDASNPQADFVCCKYTDPEATTTTPSVDESVSYNEVEVQVGVLTCGQGAGLCLLSQSCTAVQGFQSDTNGGHCNGVSKAGDSKASFVCCQYSSGASASESIPSITPPPAPPTLVAEPTSSTTTPPPSEDVSFNVLEIQGGVSSCGQGAGLCLLSTSCTVVPGFQNDPNGGHCEGVSKNNSPRAGFVCCKYVSPSRTNPTTSKNAKVDLDNPTETPLPVLNSVTNAPLETDSSSEKIGGTSTSTSATASVAKKTVSPFNIVANTNKILNGIQNLIYGGRMRPSAAMQKYGLSSSVASNDKSMVNLIVMGLKLNETTARSADLIN